MPSLLSPDFNVHPGWFESVTILKPELEYKARFPYILLYSTPDSSWTLNVKVISLLEVETSTSEKLLPSLRSGIDQVISEKVGLFASSCWFSTVTSMLIEVELTSVLAVSVTL